jgi:hypothetical protein
MVAVEARCELTKRFDEASPRFKARMSGLLYVLTFVAGLIGMSVVGGLVTRSSFNSDAVASAIAGNVVANASSIYGSVAVSLIVVSMYLSLTALWYDLFKPVNRALSLFAAFFSILGNAVQMASSVLLIIPILLLSNAQYSSAFSAAQFQALAHTFIKAYSQGLNISLVFFGFFDVLIGYLAFKSTFLPRVLGIVMIVSGFSFSTLLWLPFGTSILPYNLFVGAGGEAAFVIWLLAKGANLQRWREKANAPRDWAERLPKFPAPS